MRLETFLAKATQQLTSAGIVTARLDTLVLLEDHLMQDRAHLLAHPETIIEPAILERLQSAVYERSKHVPLAYIRQQVSFYGRSFYVDPAVLVPRPESEAMIDIAKELPGLVAQVPIADIGTGSGCLGITVALEAPSANIWLSDIDQQVLNIAKRNAESLGVHAHFVQSDLLESVPDVTIILANLPYVPENYPINTAATFEPALALFAGSDGLDLYRKLWIQIKARSHKPRHILTESLEIQHDALAKLAEQHKYRLVQTSGLVQHFSSQDR